MTQELDAQVYAQLTTSKISSHPSPIREMVVDVEVWNPKVESWPYRMARVTTLEAQEASPCWVFAGDYGDRAVHVFSSEGEYLTTYDLPGGTAQPGATLSGMTLIDPFSLAVANGSAHELWVINLRGREWTRVPLSGFEENTRFTGLGLSFGGGVFYERATSPTGRGATDPLIWAWDKSGGKIGGLGRQLVDRESAELTDIVNRGSISFSRERLWHIRHFDGRVVSFSVPPLGNGSDSRTLPIFAPPRPPTHAYGALTGRHYPTPVRYQFGPSLVDREGRFILSQILQDGITWILSMTDGIAWSEHMVLPGRPSALAVGCEGLWVSFERPTPENPPVVLIPYSALDLRRIKPAHAEEGRHR